MSQRIDEPGRRYTDVDELLDAVRDCVLDIGVRRTTVAEVARRAGVSRMTVYRRFPDVRTAVAELMTRELTAVLHDAEEEAAALPTARARLVECGVIVVDRLATHPLLRRVIELDPELLLPYIVDREGATQRAAREVIERRIAEGHADDSIRTGDPARLAHVVTLVVQSFVLSRRVIEQHHKPDAIANELRWLLDAYLQEQG